MGCLTYLIIAILILLACYWWPIVLIIIAVGIIYMICSGIGDMLQKRENDRRKRESDRQRAVYNEVVKIISENKPRKTISLSPPIPLSVDAHLLNKEVNTAVKVYKKQMEGLIHECISIDADLNRLLFGENNSAEADEKLEYLNNHASELKALKEKSDIIHDKIDNYSYKVELLNEDGNILLNIKKAFSSLLLSQKCISEETTTNKFVCNNKPEELSMFVFKYEPTIIFLEDFYFCLFSSVILVFDVNGVFSTALDPSALSIKVRKERASIHIRDNSASSHQYIAEDSKLIRRGSTRRTWLHIRRDGAPDLRYNYNPQIEYRTDTYEYVVLDFEIAGVSISFTVSSEVAGESFDALIHQYIRKCNNKHNPIPEFLLLLKTMIDEEDLQLCILTKEYAEKSMSSGYFCKVVAFDS